MRSAAILTPVVVACWSSMGLAQTPPQTTPPDAVVLRNGAMFRGTVTETIPGRSVTVTLATGSPRTFEWGEVQFAGPVAELPPQGPVPPPPGAGAPSGDIARDRSTERAAGLDAARPTSGVASPSVSQETSSPGYGGEGPPPVSVALRSEGHDRLSLYVHDPASGADLPMSRAGRRRPFRPLCSTPCSVALTPGSYRFGVSNGGSPQRVDDRVELRAPTTLVASYNDRRFLRTAGWILLIAANVVGAVVYSVITANDPPRTDGDLVRPLLISGGITVAGTAGGLALILARDQVSLEPR